MKNSNEEFYWCLQLIRQISPSEREFEDLSARSLTIFEPSESSPISRFSPEPIAHMRKIEMTSANQKVSQSRQKLTELPLEIIKSLTEYLLEELGDPSTQLEQEALQALQSGDYDSAKRFCLYDPCNSYLAAISCIASAYRSPMVADSVLRDAARHTCNVAKQRAEVRIARQFQQILS
ncbi:hypothetical protein [Chroococcidiopsis sp. CCNUC1]|uniref:hypothetical protein n=1 Tax=Chroococcidiopsis sp. CCNUC1 TaxID=2653189 RepID=UPI0020217D00|nr:hypothetical protein [Chroococcidiopsis sp. CCNUC1]URD53708.1 hypothetical protein M5J74_31915 [Chroococcidiopsis sp. CCNUC1]